MVLGTNLGGVVAFAHQMMNMIEHKLWTLGPIFKKS